MKIGFVTRSVSSRGGGLSTAALELASALRETSASNVYLFATSDSESANEHESSKSLSLLCSPFWGPAKFGYSPYLLPKLLEANLDILHCHGLWTYNSIVCRQWAQRTGNPYVVSPHGMLDSWALKEGGVAKKLAWFAYERRNLQGANCIHALCDSEAESVRGIGLKSPVFVIPNGVRAVSQVNGEPTWRFNGILREAKILLFLGRLHRKKGLSNLLRAWAEAIRNYGSYGWHLVIAGWGEAGHERELRSLASTLQVNGSVHFVGAQFGTAKECTLATADAFILPSRSEGLPVAVLEAWAHGKPVLMTSECNLPEGYVSGAAMRIGSDAIELAGALRALFLKPQVDLREMGAEGRLLVSKRFSWERIACRMYEKYQEIVNDKSKGR
jgi:glycosyltransferase involved in cell wall biosynthesis